MIKINNKTSLKNYNTFGVEAIAKYFAIIKSTDDLLEIRKLDLLSNNRKLILGKGSNILFANNFDGLVLYNSIKGISVKKEDEKFLLIEVGSGESWSDFVDYTVNNGWWGIENLSLIPGTVGAAPVQNIGAYGVEQEEAMQYLKAFNFKTGKIETFFHEDCHFDYRTSIFKTIEKQNLFIVKVAFRLEKLPKYKLDYKPLKQYFKTTKAITPKTISDFIKDIRKSKLPDPKYLGNGGSFFKNPIVSQKQLKYIQNKFTDIPYYSIKNKMIKISAAWLIEMCKWKAKQKGNVGVYEKHALVLVNYGNATGKEILSFSNEIRKSVFDKFKIKLENEINVIY